MDRSWLKFPRGEGYGRPVPMTSQARSRIPQGIPGSWHLDLENQEWVIGYHNWRPTGRQIFAHVSYWHPTGHLFFDPWPFWVWVFGGSLNVCVFFWMVVYVRLPGHHLPIVRSCVDQLINPNEYQWIPVLGFVLDAAKWFTYAYLPLDQWGMWWYVSGMCSYNVLSCFYIHVISMFNMI
jgi:hypothetical protein